MRNAPAVLAPSARTRALPLILGGTLAMSTLLQLASAQSNGIANVNFLWTDRAGTSHAVGFAYNSGAYDTNLSSNNSAGAASYLSTSGAGSYSGFSSNPFGSNFVFRGNIQNRFGTGTDPNATEWFRITAANNAIWADNFGDYNVPENTSPTFTKSFDNDTLQGTAFGIGQFLAFGRNYVVNRLGGSVPYFTVRYDPAQTSGSFYEGGGTPRITVDYNTGWCSSDVILHEFGHHVGASNNLTGDIGGVHSFGVDNIRGETVGGTVYPARGASDGSKLAYSEGFASYFGLSAVQSGNLGGAIPNLPAQDRDTSYAQYRSTGSRAGETELQGRINAELPTSATGFLNSRRGEGDEYAVLLAMWDVYDAQNEALNETAYHPKTRQFARDRVTYGDKDAYDRLIKNNASQNFRGYWNNITADAGTAAGRAKIAGLATNQKDEAVAAHGEILEAASLSGIPLNNDNNAQLLTTRPRFEFLEGNFGNSKFYEFLIFTSDWSSIAFTSPLFQDATPNTLDTVAFTITSDLAQGTYWWVVLNSPAELTTEAQLASRYSYYWSGARQFTVVPVPASGVIALGALGVLARRRRQEA